MTSKRLYGLDFLKIFAILWICLYHFLDFRNGWKLGSLFDSGELVSYFAVDGIISAIPQLVASMGGIGVHIFIIASGMGLALSIKGGDLKLVEFLKKRVFRILPHYWVLLLGIFLIKLIQGDVIHYFDWLTHFLGIHTFFPAFTYSISTPLWFIGVIFQLYLLFPILYRLIKKLHPAIFILLIVVAQVLLNTFFVQLFDGGRFFTEFILSFSAGIYLGNLINTGKLKIDLKKSIGLIIIGIIGAVVLLFKGYFEIPSDIIGLIFSLISISIFIGLLRIGEGVRLKKTFVFLSAIAYPLYLTHYFVFTHILPKFDRLSFVIELPLFLLMAFGLSLLLDYVAKGAILLMSKIKP